jgi:tetratricopeptide (TPR) repeat protein
MRQIARRFLSVLLATALVFGPAHSVFAQDQGAQQNEEFKRLTSQAQEQFSAKNYEAAAELFIKAYELKPVSNILYNVARIYEQAGNLEQALTYYQKFVKSPNVEKENRDDALERIKSLREVLALDEDDEKQEQVAEPVKPAEPEYDYTLAYVFWGVGAAALAGSLVFGILASDQHSKFEDATTIDERRDAADSGQTMSIVSDSLLISGAVLGVLGTVFFFTASPTESDQIAIMPIIGTDRVGMGLSFGF